MTVPRGHEEDGVEELQAIIQSQKQWMAIIDAITDYIFVVDEEGRIVKANQSLAATTGRHPRDLIGRLLHDVLPSQLAAAFPFREVLAEGRSRTYEWTTADGVFQISIFPLLDEGRSLAIHVMKDVTEVKRLKDQLYHSEKLASIGLLVSGVAHEINNPLTGTIAYTELLRMKTSDPDTQRELKKILDSAERCKKIVDNLLTFSRQRTPSKSLESVNGIIDRAVDLRSYWLRSNNITVERDYEEPSSIFADGQQIQQVVLNVLMNAEQAIVGAGVRGGRIVFTTRYDRERKVEIITVANNGPAIAPQVLPRIFDPFFTTKPVSVGTGLGLSISHGIVTEHGGTIIAVNEADGMVAFTIELPTGIGTPLKPAAAG